MEDANMRLQDRLFMHPMDKYRKYGRFPWKMLVHLLLVFFTTAQTILIVNENAMYSMSQLTLWNKLFLNHEVEGDDTSLVFTYNLFDLEKLQKYVNKTIETYYDINSHTFDNYDYRWEHGVKMPINMYVKYLNNNQVDKAGYEFVYYLNRTYYGPFQIFEGKTFLDKIQYFQLEFYIKHVLPDNLEFSSTCFEWKLTQTYDFEMHGPITVTLDAASSVCDYSDIAVFKRYLWVDIATLFLSLSALVLSWKYFTTNVILIATLQGNSSASEAWDSLGLREKLHFFNSWEILGVIGNLFQVFGTIMSFVDTDLLLTTHEVLIGFGCWFAWVNIVRYLSHNEKAYLIINTLKRAFPMMIRYMIGILPIFMGYVFLGIAVFWESGMFGSTTDSMSILYAVVNGDSVLLSIQSTEQVDVFLGQLYTFSFIVFFICCVQNIFIAIVQDGFNSLKERPIKHAYEIDEDYYKEKFQKSHGNPRDMARLQSELRSRLNLKKLINEDWRPTLSEQPSAPLLAESEQTMTQIDRLMRRLQAVLGDLCDIASRPGLNADEQLEIKQAIAQYLDVDLPQEIEETFRDSRSSGLEG